MHLHVKIRHNGLYWSSKPLDHSPNHVIRMVPCISTSLAMSDHSPDCGEVSFERGSNCRNGNISVKLCGFVCNYKNGHNVHQLDATRRSTKFPKAWPISTFLIRSDQKGYIMLITFTGKK